MISKSVAENLLCAKSWVLKKKQQTQSLTTRLAQWSDQ